jgi:hypothetical protein
MSELEHELQALAPQLAVPREDLRIPVRAGILERRSRRRRRDQLLIAATMVSVAVAPALAVPSSRSAILQLLGVRNGAPIRDVQAPPKRPSTLTLGEPTTLTSANALVSFRVLLPRGVRADGVYVGSGVAGDTITLIFRAGGMRLRLTEFRGRAPLTSGGLRVNVDGRTGFWLAPAGRFSFRDANGAQRDVVQSPVGNALVWQRGPLTLQLQAVGLTRPTALAFAHTVV